MRRAEVYYPLRPLVGHRLAWLAERALAWLQRRELCAECGDTARYPVGVSEKPTVRRLIDRGALMVYEAPRFYCRPCAWQQTGGAQPLSDPDNEPPGLP